MKKQRRKHKRHYAEKTLIIRRQVRETFEVSRTLKSSCTKFFRIMSKENKMMGKIGKQQKKFRRPKPTELSGLHRRYNLAATCVAAAAAISAEIR
jgi:hypothetical protein